MPNTIVSIIAAPAEVRAPEAQLRKRSKRGIEAKLIDSAEEGELTQVRPNTMAAANTSEQPPTPPPAILTPAQPAEPTSASPRSKYEFNLDLSKAC